MTEWPSPDSQTPRTSAPGTNVRRALPSAAIVKLRERSPRTRSNVRIGAPFGAGFGNSSGGLGFAVTGEPPTPARAPEEVEAGVRRYTTHAMPAGRKTSVAA